MSTIGNTYLTLADLYKRQDGKKDIAKIIEMCSQINPILQDALAVECNDGTTHLTTVRTGIPEPTWRALYQGVQPSKTTTRQVRDATGLAEDWSEIDAELVKLSGNPAALRLSEAKGIIEGINAGVAQTLFYGNGLSSPAKFHGLAPRFSDTNAENGNQIILGDGQSSNNTSIWFIVWGENTCHLIYPKGTSAGLQREDLGQETKTNSDGSMYRVYRERFAWHIGLSVRDWRYVVRIANIDVTNLTPSANTGSDLIQLMISAYYRLHQRRVMGGRAAIYCNTTIKEYLHKQALSKTTNALRIKEQEGEEIITFLGIPIRECDAILNNEEKVS